MPSVVVAALPEDPGDDEHERDERASDVSTPTRVGGEAAEVDRAGLPLIQLLVVDAELRAGEQDRGAEALDLEVPLQLRPEAEADPAGREDEEGQNEHRSGDDEGGSAPVNDLTRRTPPARRRTGRA